MRIALFDLDHTLIPLDSDHAWGEFTTAIGWTDAEQFKARNDAYYADYQAGTLNIADYVRFTTEATRVRGPQAAQAAQQRFMDEWIRPAFKPQALALLERHRQAGDRLAIVTATNEFVTRPIATALGVQDLIAIELARDGQGWITGEIAGTPSFREGKVTRVAHWLAAQGLDWSGVQIHFYSDSMNDLPLLEKAQWPVATNPDARLEAEALKRHWPVLRLFEDPA
ncbi:phosphoserine phosphatase [Comamonas serinivorans]|uniref:Phosphoserine phosphatase n=1 Tax=Comamonas serinivorans TaxID=1082851 RepID=A0A1Y0EKT8_9BURK|nr:HAD family hydrolase [Comamonas serinivorans]ARU03979.1 phosphoserine phosphatase [Comamonas serinivorans]